MESRRDRQIHQPALSADRPADQRTFQSTTTVADWHVTIPIVNGIPAEIGMKTCFESASSGVTPAKLNVQTTIIKAPTTNYAFHRYHHHCCFVAKSTNDRKLFAIPEAENESQMMWKQGEILLPLVPFVPLLAPHSTHIGNFA